MDTHKILLVDDEKNILRSLIRLLAETEYEVYTENNPHKALELLRKDKFSLIISDQKMPEMTGTEMLKIAKKIQPDAIRIVLSGYAEVDVIIEAINEGEIYKFITKPWNDEHMLLEVHKALEYYDLMLEKEKLMEKIQDQNVRLKKFNVELEKKVEEKTKELQLAYTEKVLLAEQLQEKVDELNGRDIILQHLLSIHSLEETLNVTLEVICNVLGVRKALIYLKSNRGDFLEVKAAIGLKEKRIVAGEKELDEIDKIDLFDEENFLIKVFKKGDSIKRKDENIWFFPIKKDQKILGVIQIENEIEITESEIDKLSGFISLSAVAINDSLMNDNLPEIQSKLEEMLGDL